MCSFKQCFFINFIFSSGESYMQRWSTSRFCCQYEQRYGTSRTWCCGVRF
jgi:hypothetical protein